MFATSEKKKITINLEKPAISDPLRHPLSVKIFILAMFPHCLYRVCSNLQPFPLLLSYPPLVYLLTKTIETQNQKIKEEGLADQEMEIVIETNVKAVRVVALHDREKEVVVIKEAEGSEVRAEANSDGLEWRWWWIPIFLKISDGSQSLPLSRFSAWKLHHGNYQE